MSGDSISFPRGLAWPPGASLTALLWLNSICQWPKCWTTPLVVKIFRLKFQLVTLGHILMCRCLSGEDWWYMGERCERRGSTQDTIVIAASSTAAVFAVMLIVTLVSVYCVRKRYRSRTSSNTADMTLENVSWVWYLVIQKLWIWIKSYEEELGLSSVLKKDSLFSLLDSSFKPWVPVAFTIGQQFVNWSPQRLWGGSLYPPGIVWLYIFFWGEGLWPFWKAKLILPWSPNFPRRGDRWAMFLLSRSCGGVWAQACRKGVPGCWRLFH